MLEIGKKVFLTHSGELSGELDVIMHGLKLKVEYYYDENDGYTPELSISDVGCQDEDVFVSFDEKDERFAMSIAELSTYRFSRA